MTQARFPRAWAAVTALLALAAGGLVLRHALETAPRPAPAAAVDQGRTPTPAAYYAALRRQQAVSRADQALPPAER